MLWVCCSPLGHHTPTVLHSCKHKHMKHHLSFHLAGTFCFYDFTVSRRRFYATERFIMELGNWRWPSCDLLFPPLEFMWSWARQWALHCSHIARRFWVWVPAKGLLVHCQIRSLFEDKCERLYGTLMSVSFRCRTCQGSSEVLHASRMVTSSRSISALLLSAFT